MIPYDYYKYVVKPAMELYDEKFTLVYEPITIAKQIIAVSMQESGLVTRRQFGGGPARGYLQFEQYGVILDIVTRRNGSRFARMFNLTLNEYMTLKETATELYVAVEYNDILGVMMMIDKYRLDHISIANDTTDDQRWDAYIKTWAPGKPRREHWGISCAAARGAVG